MCDKMNVRDVRNNHLQKIIEDIFDFPGEYLDESLITDLKMEVRFSTFICPACVAGILLLGDEGEGGVAIPAFTDMNKYNLEFEGANIEPVSWQFSDVGQYLENENFEGIIVNPHIDDFFISSDIIRDALDMIPSFTSYSMKKSKFSDEEVMEIFENENADIDEYMVCQDFSFEHLIHKLSKTDLFALVSSADDFTSKIVRYEDISSDGFLTVNEFNGEHCLIFSSPQHIVPVKKYYENNQRRLYAFPTTLELMAKYILELDLDGLILNYAHHSFRISREMLLVYINDIAEIADREIQHDLSDYLFNI